MSSNFKLYTDGSVQFVEARLVQSIAFAHVTDLHLPGVPRDAWPGQYRSAIEWWNQELGYPDQVVETLLDEIKAARVDFVFFGGDVLDYYNAGTAKHLLEMCQQRGLTAKFQLGNHDYESEYLRFVSHEFDPVVFSQNSRKLCNHWRMPNLDYFFEIGGVQFLSLSVEYKHLNGTWGGTVTDEQAYWLIAQIRQNKPLVIFHHIPFALPTVAPRLAQFWSGKLACIRNDDNGRRLREAIEENHNVLGTFSGHAHMRSEDPFGQTWQFITGPGHLGQWRYVKISGERPPKSLNIEGEPKAFVT